jgi:predicted  nucleic acid-binding Zn-ribbon protein
MALADIRNQVRLALAQTRERQREARAMLAAGTDEEKVEAAGELDILARQRAMLEARMREVDRRIVERRTLFSWYRQTWFSLMFYFESWIAHG